MKIPFIGKKEEEAPREAPETTEPGDADSRKAVDKVDLISHFIEIHDKKMNVSPDYVLFRSTDADEEFFRGMTKCGVNAELLIAQAAEKWKGKEMAKLEKKNIKTAERKEEAKRIAREYEATLRLGKMAYRMIVGEPHMVAILKRNRKDNAFAQGAFLGQAEENEESGKTTIDKLKYILGESTKVKQ